MANKKPLTLGKGTPNTPAPQRNPNGRRPSSTKPSQSGLVRSAQKTTSSGITERPDGRAQSEGRSGRQSISKATVSNSGQGVTPGSAGGRVTTGQGRQRVVLPPVPPKPKPTYTGTTNTIRATGGNSRDAKINRLSAQTAPMTGNSPLGPQPKPKPTAASNLAKSQQMLRNQMGPVASALGGIKSLGMQAIAESVAPRPTANQDVAYNQKKVADVLKMKKKRTA